MEEPNGDSRDAKLSTHESALWAKKGVFGKKGVLQDIMSVAFGPDGITYVGTADGHIYRFAEQSMDIAVKAHGEPTQKDCKVSSSGIEELAGSGPLSRHACGVIGWWWVRSDGLVLGR